MSPGDRAWILTWAGAYERGMGTTEPHLFTDVGPAAAGRGYYTRDELIAVARWKTSRSQSQVAANCTVDIEDLTRIAFAAPERLQHRILTLLSGVQVRTATALLTVAFPTQHTVLDVRSTEALARLGAWNGTGSYLVYLDVCRTIARERDISLRQIDRALWKWSKAKFSLQPPAILG